jgi:DNA polymerase III subunit delta'
MNTVARETKSIMWYTIGHTQTVDLFQRAFKQGTLSHAYLLAGPPQVGKMTLALDIARLLNCRAEPEKRPCGECPACKRITEGKHSDVQILALNQNGSDDVKEKTEIGIDLIKDMLHSASLPPFEGFYRVYIIDEAANLSMEAANRLLKTLEEPEGKVLFILLTVNANLIPLTVVSRCQKLKLSRLNTAEIEKALIERWQVEPEKAGLLARLSHGCPGWAIGALNKSDLSAERGAQFERMLTIVKGGYSERFAAASQIALQFAKKRETVYETLDTWAGWWRDILLAKTDCSDNINSTDFSSALSEIAGNYSLVQIKSVINYILEAAQQLRQNASSRLVLEALMLNIPRAPETASSGACLEV